MKRLIAVAALLALLFAVPACQATNETGVAMAHQLYAEGKITAEQRDVMLDTFDGGGLDWEKLIYSLGSVLASWGVITLQRGTISHRKGLPPTT